MGGIDTLIEQLRNDSVVFFVGSGVSYNSRLPSATDILRGTCQKLLPSLSKEQKELILNGQPEVVYAALLECCHQDTNCLDMWKCLSPANWNGEYAPEANFEHCFIAAYSRRARVPIFTVNYDTMFENACEKLGMKKGTEYAVATEYAQIDLSKDILYICKLHGDICEAGDRIDPNIFKTTMTEITKKNGPWLDYLFQIMETKHICFAGYSGRDIDYYPFLKQKLNSRQVCSSFWTLKNSKDEEGNIVAKDLGWENAIAITSGQVIEKFPSDFFPHIYETVFKDECGEDKCMRRSGQTFKEKLKSIHSKGLKNLSLSSSARENFLAQVRSEIRAVKLSEEIFLMRFLQLQGKNRESELVFQDRLASRISEFEEWEKWLILDAKMTVEREHAHFLEYRKTAKEIRRIARERRKRAVGQKELEIAKGQEFNARVQIISSYQMEIPTRLQFKLPLRLRGYGRLLAVKAGFCMLDMSARLAGKSFCRTNVVVIQESQLRSYAMDVGLAEKLCKSDLPMFRWFVKNAVRRLKRLREAAYAVGNYETVIGTMKYLTRLIPEEGFGDEAKVFGGLVSDLSAVSIIKRDSFSSEEEFQEALAEAKGNDNTLNVIKTYLKYASERMKAEKKPLLCEEYASEMTYYMDKVESAHLQKCFEYIKMTYLQA